MSPINCKKHGKPRTVIYDRKMPNGAVFPLVGCEDCAAGKPRAESPAKKKKPVGVARLKAI
jgi:hypothetical protein